MSLYRTATILCLLLFPLQTYAETPSAEPVTKETFIDLLERNHPIFAKERLTQRIEEADRQSTLGDADWNFSSSLTYNREEPTLSVSGPERTDALTLRTGMAKRFWNTGGRLTATYSISRSSNTIEQTPFFPYPEKFYENSVELEYAQPLLRNRGGLLTRLQYDLKGYDVDISGIRALETIEDFLVEAVSKYLDWVYLEEQKKIVSRRLRLSRSELQRARRKFKAYLVDSVDVIRAMDAVTTWRQNLGLVDSRLSAIRSELAVLVQDERFLSAMPDFDLFSLERPDSFDAARAGLEDRSRILKILRLQQAQLDVSARGYRETAKPDLSLIAAITAKNGEGDLSDSFSLEKNDAAIGLQLSVPVENREAEANIEKARLQKLRLDKEDQDVSLNLTSSLASLHAQLRKLSEVLRLNREQIETARLRTVEETKLYEQGRGDLTFVIMSRDNEESAKLAYVENALNYQKLWLRYQALMDELYR